LRQLSKERNNGDAVKLFASLLMVVILLHCACMGGCLGQAVSVKPPCHEQEETPQHDANWCSEGPATEVKTAPVILPGAIPVPAATSLASWQRESSARFEPVSPPLLRLPVLRI
jgi:hypothetical protein